MYGFSSSKSASTLCEQKTIFSKVSASQWQQSPDSKESYSSAGKHGSFVKRSTFVTTGLNKDMKFEL